MLRIALPVGLCVVLAGCRLAEREMQDRTPQGCAQCHTHIAQQWERSAHAAAWTSPAFVARTFEHGSEACLPCHAPRPLLEQHPVDPPQLRDHQRQLGIDCAVCHQVGCGYAGPYRSHIGPHPTEQDTTRLPCPDFCGTCHGTEQQEYASLYIPAVGPDAAKSCVACHMPGCRERLTQGHVLSYIHPKRITHDHEFPTWTAAVTAGAVAVTDFAARPADGQVEVCFTLTNRGAGHRIPTGKHGDQALRLLVEAVDGQGHVLGEHERSLRPGDEGLIPGAATPFSMLIRLDGAPRPAQVRLLVERVSADRSFRYALAHASVPVAP